MDQNFEEKIWTLFKWNRHSILPSESFKIVLKYTYRYKNKLFLNRIYHLLFELKEASKGLILYIISIQIE